MEQPIFGIGMASYPAGVILQACIYEENHRPAFKLVCADDGMPYGSLTVNVPELELAEDEILVSADWNLPTDVKSALLDSGKFERTGRANQAVSANYDVWRVLDAELLADVAGLRPKNRRSRQPRAVA
ncbi:hypothetical protein RN01_24820 [Cupriavidus sp. SHE]|uniref:hypothetical protein n=1 Tax=Cupriavidus TaxID=106589 RepID=UPI000561A9AF|nr:MULTISPECIES: hypothetical protein [Cupriavidus]KWR78008.1 hypothetical protein RN01_24820 [Cupriavidus sp. SHE]GMG94648.1 hypothetical protein Cmtc_58680 [Cupriavidus sp. TKC]